jgi:adenosine kinase
MVKYVHECNELGIPYIFDPSQQIVRLDEDGLTVGLTGAKALFANEYEFELLQKHTHVSAEGILQDLEFGVITCGKQGSQVYEYGNLKGAVPVFETSVMGDPTGVGDAFRAGFLKGYLHGFDLVLCAQMGSLAATYCLEEAGPQSQCYAMKDFVTRFRTQFDDKGVLDQLK